MFNALYYRKHPRRAQRGIVNPEKFFYPLDALHYWYRLYGRRGFTQYQCVIPKEAGLEAVHDFMTRLVRAGVASPLCVLKNCGEQGVGTISFPMPGTSVAVDIPVRSNTVEVVHELNQHVIDCGGRIYLAKDTFTSREDFERMEPRLAEWKKIRARWDPNGVFRSAQSERLLGD